MAKRARKQTEAERATIDAERELAREHSGYDMPTEMGISSGEERNEAVAEYMNAPLDAEITEEQDDALAKLMGDGEGDAVEITEEEPKESISVVKDKFKVKYIENARALGLGGKAAKRSNWDWLSQQLATFCLNDKHSIDIGAFTDVLDANGVDHSRWTNRNRGWEGRFRMTGRVALQKVVANAGVLKWPTGSESEAPAEFIEKYKTKA
jgi:hypothetical protein